MPSHGFHQVEPLTPHSRRRKPEWAIRQLVLLKAHLPDAGCRCLASTFNRVFAHRSIWVSKTWVHRVLRARALEVEAARRAIRRAKPRVVDVNHCWAIDITGKADAQGAAHTMLGVLDHGSRRVLALKKIPRKCGWTLLGHVCLTIAEYGKPRFIRTDNERCFTGRVFSAGLRLLGIGHQKTELHMPWQNGRIERLFGTLKGKLRQVRFDGGGGLSLLLADFVRWYNELRPHQNLGGLTPLEAWDGIDAFHAPTPPKSIRLVEGWDGLLRGFHIRRQPLAAAASRLRTRCPARERVKPVLFGLEPAQVGSTKAGWR